jgi:hypothetical protein
VKHLQVKVLKVLQQKLIHPSLGCMPPYRLGQKFDFDDDTVIVSKTLLKKINFVLQDMGPGNISREMLKNPPRDKKSKNSVQK